jgi:hypothetical protein
MDSKILSSSKINPTKLLGGSSFANNTNNISEKLKEDSITISKSDLSIIKGQVFEIKNLVTNLTTLKKKRLKTERKETEREKFDKKEKELEKKKKPEDNKIKLPQAPKLGFLDIIRRFVVNTLIGFIAIRLIKHLPKMIEVVKFLGGAMDFITNVGGKLLDGLATFVQKSYEAYDATRGLIKNLGGENFAKGFDKFISAIDTALFLTTALAGAMAVEALTSDDDPGVMDLFRKKKVAKAVKGVTTTAKGAAAKGAGIGAGAATAIVAGAGLLASALGEGAFQVRKFAVKPIEKLENDQKNDKNPLTKIGRGVVLTMVRPLFGLFQGVGFLLDIIGAPFRYAIELIRYPFLSEEDKVKQANNLAKLDARIREDFRKGLNMLTLGLAFKEKGSFGNIYGNKGAQKEMMGKMQGGGQAPVTRGGKLVSGPRRSITKSKVKRQIAIQPTQLKPGADVGGEEKIEKVFPKSKDKNQVSPLDYIEKSYKNTNQDKSFGSLLNLQTKSLVGQKPSKIDYKNAAQGLSNWMTMTFSDEILRTGAVYAAGGGEINADMLSKKSGDMTDAIARSLEDSISKRLDANIDDLMKQMMLKGIEPDDKDKQKAPDANDMGEGVGVQVSSDSPDFWILATAALFENSHPQGAADAAQAIYNRVAMPGDPWKVNNSIRTAILNPNQFQPVRQYGGTAAWARIKTKDDALRFIRSHGKTQAQLETVAAALLDKEKQNSARQFVGPRDSFRSVAYENANNHLADDTEVRRHGHVFGFEPRGATIGSFRAGKLTAASVNANVMGNVNLKGGDGSFIQGNSGRSEGTHFHIGTNKPGDASGVASAGFGVIKRFLGKKSVYVGRSRETIPTNATDDQIKGYIGRGQAAHRQTELDLQIGGTGAGNKVPFPLALTGMKYSSTDGYGVSANIVGTNAFVGHGRYKPDGTLAPQQLLKLNTGAPDYYAFHGMNKLMTKDSIIKVHKGEYVSVTDNDSTKIVGVDFIATINAIENKTQLQQKVGSLIDYLSYITGYEPGGQQEVVVEMPEPAEVIPVMMPVPDRGGGMMIAGSGYDYTQGLSVHG